MTENILVIGDSPTVPTGFSTVIYNIFAHLDKNNFNISQLGVNYYGDPYTIPWKIYPASLRGDVWGFGRINELLAKKFDLIFILNDIWVISKYLEEIKKSDKHIPPIVVYFPVDSEEFDSSWFDNFDIVSKAVVYTEFGEKVCRKAKEDLTITIIPHGVDKETFFRINKPKEEIKKTLFPNTPEFIDSFIVLNANRNQPRKRIDLTIEGFSLFAKNKPENVKLYLHMGLKDSGVDIIRLCKRYDIDKRLIVTNKAVGIQSVPTSHLNIIYNATDIGINTALGEGFGLVNIEHAVTGAPQIVPKHSACEELFSDCGLLIPINQRLTNQDFLTVGGLVHPEDVACCLEKIYSDKELYGDLSAKSIEKFSSDKYDWKNISDKFKRIFEEVL